MFKRATAASLCILLGCTPGYSSDFRFDKAVEYYCSMTTEINPKTQNRYQRGLLEGLAMGIVIGEQDGQFSEWANSTAEDFQHKFHGAIKSTCPKASFPDD